MVFFKDNLIAGDVPKYASIDMSNNESSLSADASNEILISEFISNKLDKEINDYLNIYFVPEYIKKMYVLKNLKLKVYIIPLYLILISYMLFQI